MTWQPRRESSSGIYHVVVRGAGRRILFEDDEAAGMARRMFGDEFANSIASMPREERNAALSRLRHLGLSVRQIERLTGVGRGIIQKL